MFIIVADGSENFCLNPYSNGIPSDIFPGKVEKKEVKSLNPYSNGIPSDSVLNLEECASVRVLILILMEYPLTLASLVIIGSLTVLILILMEYPLTPYYDVLLLTQKDVLILILMEYPLTFFYNYE